MTNLETSPVEPEEKIYKTEDENIKENECREAVEPPLERPKTIDKSELEKSNQQKLAGVGEFLKSEMEKSDGWEVVRRPRE